MDARLAAMSASDSPLGYASTSRGRGTPSTAPIGTPRRVRITISTSWIIWLARRLIEPRRSAPSEPFARKVPA